MKRKEYSGKEAKNFTQTRGKKYLLNPAFKRNLPLGNNKTLLDVGCGDGFYSELLKNKKYLYTGVDNSYEMIEKAKKSYPKEKFIVADAMNLQKSLATKYDVVIASMLFPEFRKLTEVSKILKSINKVINRNGKLYVGIDHPCFDKYMQKFLFDDKEVITDFKGYFKSEAKFTIPPNKNGISFIDTHFTLSDYINTIIENGFKIDHIDECKAVKETELIEGAEYLNNKRKYPTFMFIKAQKVN